MSISWVEVHGALTHMPLAFLLAVPVFEIGAFLWRRPEWRIVSFWLLAAAVVMAVPSLATGWITGNDLGFTGASAHPPGPFTQHRLLAFITSGVAVVLLLWRIRSRDQLNGRSHIASVLLSLVIAGSIGYVGYLGGKMVFGGANDFDPATMERGPAAKVPLVPRVDPQFVATGSKLFKEYRCQACHRMNGTGADAGPDLTHEARRHPDMDWQITHLKNPQKIRPGSSMPAFDDLSPQELKALAAFLATRK